MELPLKLSFHQALDGLKSAVETKGENYVYPHLSCQYFDADDDGCIVGYVLAQNGMTLEDLRSKCQADEGCNSNLSVIGLVQHEILQVNRATLILLKTAQDNQDNKIPWGVCVERAIESVGGTNKDDPEMVDPRYAVNLY